MGSVSNFRTALSRGALGAVSGPPAGHAAPAVAAASVRDGAGGWHSVSVATG
ncbi:hypothetical protein AB0D66_30365 [Streptomyces sp. NPDC048270]|uniref:hypothetical protein n=1 Tax=Streptomyces sp. NPDC048270 TaxID=3154615 RepID=UPI00340FBE8B